MDMPAEVPASFDCRATAAVLRSGGSVAVAGHVAALMNVLAMYHGGPLVWIAWCGLLVWCVVVYLAIRVKIDTQFFALLATEPADQLDTWLAETGLRKDTGPRTLPERRSGALRLWRMLVAGVALEIVLLLAALLRLLA
jgi:hypothetical protein